MNLETAPQIDQYKFCNDIIALKNEIEKNFLTIGAGLKRIRDERLYLPAWETFEDYCEEMKMSKSTASKLINIYGIFILDFNIPEEKVLRAGGWTVASEIATALVNKPDGKEHAEKMLDLSGVLTRQDFHKELNALKTGLDEIECLHPDAVELHFKYCPHCKMKQKIYQ